MGQKSETEIALHQISLDIERAIEAVRGTTATNDGASELSSVYQAMQNSKKISSSPEKPFSSTKEYLLNIFKKKEPQQNEKTIKGSLHRSLNLIKIYSSALSQVQKESSFDTALSEKVLNAIHDYNSLLRQSKSPLSISGKIKHFFLRMTGWTATEEWLPREIQVPAVFQQLESDSLFYHKITFKKEITGSKKISALVQSVQTLQDKDLSKPKKQEIDAFRLKALLLLQQQEDFTPLHLEEVITTVHKTPIIVTPVEMVGAPLLQFQQVISDFPGEEIEIKGLFRRDNSFLEMSIPLKESFQLTKSSSQSGFPHPSQYTGIAFHELLIPQCLVSEYLLPELEQLLRVKRQIAQELSKNLNKKAKMLLEIRRLLFVKEPALIQLQKLQIQSLCQEANKREVIDAFFTFVSSQQDPFNTITNIHQQINQLAIKNPITLLQQEWLVNNHPDFSVKDPEKAYVAAKSLLEAELEKAQLSFDRSPIGSYQSVMVQTIGKAAVSLYLLQLSEHLKFPPQALNEFEKIVFVSLFRQLLVFADELQNFPDSDVCIHLFEEYLVEQIEEETALFTGTSSLDPHTGAAKKITDSLLNYYEVLQERGMAGSIDESKSCV